MRLLLKRIIGQTFGRLTHSIDGRRVILIYHSIGDQGWAVTQDDFYSQIKWLSNNAKIVGLSELLHSKVTSEKLLISITFDDGYRSVYDSAFPIMSEFNCTGTVYVNSGWISEKINRLSEGKEGHYPGESFMTWEQVIDLFNHNWNIGSHGVDHVDLRKVSDKEIKYQLSQSKKDIESHLKTECKDFSYTWGSYTENLCNKVRDSGYQTAVSGQHGRLKSNSSLLSLPRIDVRREYTESDFSSIVSGNWDFLGVIQNYRRTKIERIN